MSETLTYFVPGLKVWLPAILTEKDTLFPSATLRYILKDSPFFRCVYTPQLLSVTSFSYRLSSNTGMCACACTIASSSMSIILEIVCHIYMVDSLRNVIVLRL